MDMTRVGDENELPLSRYSTSLWPEQGAKDQIFQIPIRAGRRINISSGSRFDLTLRDPKTSTYYILLHGAGGAIEAMTVPWLPRGFGAYHGCGCLFF